jgi:hypothetical protein
VARCAVACSAVSSPHRLPSQQTGAGGMNMDTSRHEGQRPSLSVGAGQATSRSPPGSSWHLDHADDRRGYLGPAHAACNIYANGGGRVHWVRVRFGTEPRRWSREWLPAGPSAWRSRLRCCAAGV